MRRLRFRLTVLVLMACTAWAQPFMYRPGQEHRSLSSEFFTISVQKNGRLDVILSSGVEYFANAYPMLWLDGEEGPREFQIKGKKSYRQEVNTRLGRGHGMALESKEGVWSLQTYPTKPFLIAQAHYTNSGKNPVRVRALYPWCVGGKFDGHLSLGPTDQSWILAPWPAEQAPQVTQHGARGLWTVAAHNAATRLSLIAGFLTYGDGNGVLEISRNARDASASSTFTAEHVFDPPVEVLPGETVSSGYLYLGVAESDVFEGLERFAVATGLINIIERGPSFVPQIWVATRPDEGMAADAAWVGEHLMPYGWNTGMVAVERDLTVLRDVGLKAGLDVRQVTGDDVHQILQRSNADVVVIPDSSPALAETAAKVEPESVVALGGHPWEAGQTASLIVTAAGAPRDWDGVAHAMGDAMRRYFVAPWLGRPLMPAIELGPGSALTPEQRRTALTAMALLAGTIQVAGSPPAWSSDDLATLRRLLPTPDKPARPIDLFSGNDRSMGGPTASPPAIPSQLVLPLDGSAGNSLLIATFNWDSRASAEFLLDFGHLGLSTDAFYTVYDFWEDQYLGTAQGGINVAVAPGAVRVLALSPHREMPVLLGTSDSVAMGGTDLKNTAWNSSETQLHGVLQMNGAGSRALRILAPAEWRAKGVEVSAGTATVAQEGRLVRVSVSGAREASVSWKVRF